MDASCKKRQIDLAKPRHELTEDDFKFESKRQVLIKRIIVSIVLLLKENPMLPFHFNFMGECQLETLKQQRHQYLQHKAAAGITTSKIESTEFDKESRLQLGVSTSSFMTPGLTAGLTQPRKDANIV